MFALLTIIWTLFRIFETKTVRGWLGKEPYNIEFPTFGSDTAIPK